MELNYMASQPKHREFRVTAIICSLVFLMSALGLMPSHAAAPVAPSYYPSGPQQDVASTSVITGGWQLCWSGPYNGFAKFSDILAACTGDYILYTGWQGVSTTPQTIPATFKVLAAAPRTDVFRSTTAGSWTATLSNGSYWSFGDDRGGTGINAVGFSDGLNAGSPCFSNGGSICWHSAPDIPTRYGWGSDGGPAWASTEPGLSPGWMLDGILSLGQSATMGNGAGYTRAIYQSVAAVTAPNAPTIGTATALSATSASISFTAPASNGGATIETYTATSTPGSITGRVFQSGSGSITITGLTPSTAYTFRVTASNSAGTSSASGATVSITTPASDAELGAQTAAAAAAAAAKREAETRLARTEIASKFKNSEKVTLESFKQAEIPGVTSENLAAVQAEIQSLPKESRSDITQITKVARKYEVIGKIASEQINNFNANDLIEVGLIPTDNKNKMALATTLKKLPQQDRDTYAEIKAAIDAALAKIQARKEKVQALIFRKPSLSQK